MEAPKGFYLEFQSPPGFELKLESLENAPAKIELVFVRKVEGKQYATVFVPEGQLSFFVSRVEEYRSSTTRRGQPRNRELVESIAEIRLAVAESFWTEDRALLPPRGDVVWWEVWLRGEGEDVVDRFRAAMTAEALALEISGEKLVFPERTVIKVRASLEQFAGSIELLDTLAELRAPKDINSFFNRLAPTEQNAWSQDLARRTTAPAENAVAVCILDTGVNRGHPLLAASVAEDDLHTCEPAWRKADHDGHGTAMAGVVTYGDLRAALMSEAPVTLSHCVESVKILPPPPEENKKELYGARTRDAIARAEIQAPERLRVISMAVTAEEDVDDGLPSAWSAEVDALCAGLEGQRQLFFVSAGNIIVDAGLRYRRHNEEESIRDPGQAWNALTVGSYTMLTRHDEATHAGWTPIAEEGGLSPTSTTSCGWHGQWPVKPDIVMEGGNMVLSPVGTEADYTDSLSLLSTHYQPFVRSYCATGDTSSATALAARLGAIVRAAYPERWPETVRALLVDSAEWSPSMQAEVDASNGARGIEPLVRCFGFGVPQQERALYSAGNALTLIAEDELQPFEGDASKEMNLHRLPWPAQELQNLGAMEVELRVTLSYFVEPNPARRGWKKRHRYASHGLRFAMQKPAESISKFRQRVNKAARAAGDTAPTSGEHPGWLIGSTLRGKGSLHHDRWRGIAADLARCEHIAVFPVIGWWRENRSLERNDSRARYSLVVSIRTPTQNVDLYKAIQTRIVTQV